MHYTKTYKTVEEQADLLIQRGLVCNRGSLVERLDWINYYRLSGYFYPFRKPESDDFIEGTNFDQVWERYCFDRKFRLLMLDGIARVEVGIKTAIVRVFAREYGPFGYMRRGNLPNISDRLYEELMGSMAQDMNSSRAKFVEAYREKYGDSEQSLPLWMAVELMTFGKMLKFYEGMEKKLQNEIAGNFSQQKTPFISWLRSLNVVRNICAHHARLWNRVLGVAPILYPKNETKKRESKWFSPVPVNNRRIFASITLILEMLSVMAPKSGWKERLLGLLECYPNIPLVEMGFPENWRQTPFFAGTPREVLK
jgi:abortive infection bacteriophage resistance protein